MESRLSRKFKTIRQVGDYYFWFQMLLNVNQSSGCIVDGGCSVAVGSAGEDNALSVRANMSIYYYE